MVKIKSFEVGSGDTFYIRHGTDNFTVIDCSLIDSRRKEIVDEIINESDNKGIRRFISTHPDEDHFHGIEYLNNRQTIINFYCVENSAIKVDETDSFKKYCELRDSDKAFYLYKGCSRKWMNQNDDERGSPNNISPIISYELNGGVKVLWFGDLEHDFMESIEDDYAMPEADIIFAPHHGRLSGAIPQKWLEQIDPKIIIIGTAPSAELKYFNNYNTITQNSAKDITLMCDENQVHFYSSNENYGLRNYLTNKYKSETADGYYIGTLTTRSR